MSSIYSSRRPSFTELHPHVPPEHSKSAPETPARALRRPIFRTAPDSPQHNPLLSDEDGLDIDILTHKLQLYQLVLEEAQLRFKQKRAVEDKEAAEVAAAARFRDELDKLEQSSQPIDIGDQATRSRSNSSDKSGSVLPRKGLPAGLSSNPSRSKRPQPLRLPEVDVDPQEIKSAVLPARTNRASDMSAEEMKTQRRRTTIFAGRNANSKIILLSSDSKPEYCDFGLPPVPQLSASTATSPPGMSPMTPQYTEPPENQIRRELETFALEESPNIHLSRQCSVASRKRIPTAFVPDPDDKLPAEAPPPPETPDAFPDPAEYDTPKTSHPQPWSKKRGFFSRFERKNEVDALLDLYLTEEQLHEAKVKKKKSTRHRHQTFFKRWQPTDALLHRGDKPG